MCLREKPARAGAINLKGVTYMNHAKRWMALLLALLFLGGTALADTSVLNESGFPIVKEPVTLRVMGSISPVQPEFKDMYLMNKYEEMTGVHVEWTSVPSSARTERVTLAISSGDLPDVFFKCGISASSLQVYGDSGDLLDLAPMLETYAPNFWAYAQRYPDVLASVTTPDGKIYSLPAIADAPAARMNKKLYFNQHFMDALNLSQPRTADELYAVLKAMKEGDPNGNGEADEVPLSESTGTLYMVFGGLYGCFNRGTHHEEYDVDPQTGAIRHIKTSDAFRQTLEFMNRLYAEGIIDQESITFNDARAVGLISQDRQGVYFATNLALLPADKMDEWTPAEGWADGAIWPLMRSHLHSVGAFAISADCKNPEIALRWVDYFYSEEGVRFFHYGIDGDTCRTNADGSLSYVDSILAQVTGDKSYDEVVSQYSAYCGGNNPTIMSYPGYAGMELSPVPMASAEALSAYTPEIIWPFFNYTDEEKEIVTTTGTEIDNYVRQTCAEFLTGERELSDAEWNGYVQRVNDMGLDAMLKVMTDASARAMAIVDA